jgi:hypothetical protein
MQVISRLCNTETHFLIHFSLLVWSSRAQPKAQYEYQKANRRHKFRHFSLIQRDNPLNPLSVILGSGLFLIKCKQQLSYLQEILAILYAGISILSFLDDAQNYLRSSIKLSSAELRNIGESACKYFKRKSHSLIDFIIVLHLIDFFLIFSAHDEIFFPLPETEGRKK